MVGGRLVDGFKKARRRPTKKETAGERESRAETKKVRGERKTGKKESRRQAVRDKKKKRK